jgi:cysteine desulfurase
MSTPTYLDYNATAPVRPEAREAMVHALEVGGNPSSIHAAGRAARALVEQAREQVAALIAAPASTVIFTSGGTEANALAIESAVAGGARRLIVSAIEHDSVQETSRVLGVAVEVLPVTADGLADLGWLDKRLAAWDTADGKPFVALMLANNETGVIQPVREMAEIARAAGALFHTDAIQAGGKLPLDVAGLGCDLLSLSGHKMHAPQGTGVLFVRRGVKLKPLFFGGLHERGRRPGTENVAGIVGLGRAAELARAWLTNTAAGPDGTPDNPAALAALRDRLEQGILARVPDAGVNGAGSPRVPNTTNLYFDGVDADALIIALDLQGLAVSAGSACQSGATEPSHVLLAMGLSEERARGSVRLSLSRLNTSSEVDAAVELVASAVSRLRDFAPKKLATPNS